MEGTSSAMKDLSVDELKATIESKKKKERDEAAAVEAKSEAARRTVEASLARGKADFAAGNYADAERHFDAALESNLENRHEVVCNRAACAMKLGKYADAVADAAEATYLEPTYVKAHYRLACAQRALGKFDRALKAARAGLELQPASTQLSSFIKEVEEEAAAAAAAPAAEQPKPAAKPENEHTKLAKRAAVEAQLAKLALQREQMAAAQPNPHTAASDPNALEQMAFLSKPNALGIDPNAQKEEAVELS